MDRNTPPRPESLAVWVPAEGSLERRAIDEGAGIVSEAGDERVLVYLEGRRHVSNIVTFADRCANAAGRLIEQYPTSGMRAVRREELEFVGWFTPGHGVDVPDAIALIEVAKWLGMFSPELNGRAITLGDGLFEQLRVTGAWNRQVAS